MINSIEFQGGLNGIPQFNDINNMWETIDINLIDFALPNLEIYSNHLKRIYTNGDVKNYSFKLGNNLVFDWFASRNQFHDMRFFRSFWLSKTVKEYITDDLLEYNEFSKEIFEWTSPFLLGGYLAWTISAGGAYSKFPAGPVEAKRLGENVEKELIHNDYENVFVFMSNAAWSKFFFDVAWDFTLVVIDYPKRIVSVILATDTD